MFASVNANASAFDADLRNRRIYLQYNVKPYALRGTLSQHSNRPLINININYWLISVMLASGCVSKQSD